MAKVTLGEVAAECRESCRGDKSGLPAVGLEHLTPGQIRLSNWAVNTENTLQSCSAGTICCSGADAHI